MIIYTGLTGNPKHIEKIRQYNMGVMISSSKGASLNNWLSDGIPLALDNGAFSAWKKNEPFDDKLFCSMLERCRRKALNLNFFVVPDIVAGGKESLEFSLSWQAKLSDWGLSTDKMALAVQDGMDIYSTVMNNYYLFGTLFVGGTVEWKWKTAEEWTRRAHQMGMKVHIGRVSKVNELRMASKIGVDSVDSTNPVRNNDWAKIAEYHNPVQTVLNIDGREWNELPEVKHG